MQVEESYRAVGLLLASLNFGVPGEVMRGNNKQK